MFLIRQAQLDDASTLLKMARMVHSGNLPDDMESLRHKIVMSKKSFAGTLADPRDRVFLFVLVDTDTGNVIGVSSIKAAMGGPGEPLLFFQVRKRDFYSDDLQTGQVHLTLQLGADETGPTEIGGLIISPAYRGHAAKLGSFLSLVRFHYLGLHRQWFADRIVAEMMGSLNPDSHNKLWDYLGRRFINLTYKEADAFNRTSKEFITALFPKEEIYASLLPPEARSLIGKVCPEAEPAKGLLERLGFEYHGHVDPFDGGPYLHAVTDEVTLVKATHRATIGEPVENYPEFGYVSLYGASEFRAIQTNYALKGDQVSLPGDSAGLLDATVGDNVGVTPRRTRSKQTPEMVQSSSADSTEH